MKTTAVAGGTFRLIRGIVLFVLLIIIAVFTILWDFPIGVSIALFIVAVLILSYEIVSLRRVIRLAGESRDYRIRGVLQEDEVISDIIPAVMRYDKVRSVEIMGSGKVLHPENMLVLTNRSIWALTVPFEGQDLSVHSGDAGSWQWLTTYEEIEEKFNLLRKDMELAALFAACRAEKLASRGEIVSTETLPGTHAIIFRKRNGEHFSYAIRNRNDFLRIKTMFRAKES